MRTKTTDPLQPYFDAIQRLDSAEGTEHTLRGALENLLKAIAAERKDGGNKRMKETLTAVFEKSPYGYIGYVEELPGANTQGETLEETKANLIEAVQLVLQANRELAEEEIKADKREVVRESLGSIAI